MFYASTSQTIVKYFLLSLLCFESVFSAIIEAVESLEDDEDEDILQNDFFRFTTRKRYIWEDWTVPTRDPGDYNRSGSDADFFWILLPTLIICAVITFLYVCFKNSKYWCSSESDSDSTSGDRFTTVHPPPARRRREMAAQVHAPPTRRNQHSNSGRDFFADVSSPTVFSEPDIGRSATDTTGETISFFNPAITSSSWVISEPANTATEKPPDYSTVTLNDLVSPSAPSFPVVKKGNDTPPPEYGKENPSFK